MILLFTQRDNQTSPSIGHKVNYKIYSALFIYFTTYNLNRTCICDLNETILTTYIIWYNACLCVSRERSLNVTSPVYERATVNIGVWT